MLETTILTSTTTGPDAEIPSPQITVLEANETYGRFAVEPLERGFAITVGNSVRRVLLSSMPGTAITWVKVDGVLHEYEFLPNVKEEVMEFLLNVKQVRIRSLTDRPGKMRLEISGEGRVCAGDIGTSADFEIVNPELHLATLDSDGATISVEFNVERGKGYLPAGKGDELQGLPIGVLPVDAIFTPIRKVNYFIERTRIGNVTDYERLVLDVWTDGAITPVEAVRKSSEILVSHFFVFNNVGRPLPEQGLRTALAIPPELYQTPIEKLELSPRTLNCLKRAHLLKVGQVLETSDDDLLKIRNFGEKSLSELREKLQAQGFLGVSSPSSQQEVTMEVDVKPEDVAELLGEGGVGGPPAQLEVEEEEGEGDFRLEEGEDEEDLYGDEENEE